MKNVHICYIGVTVGKFDFFLKQSRQNEEISILIVIYTTHFAYLNVYTKFINTGSNRSSEICDRNFHWKER